MGRGGFSRCHQGIQASRLFRKPGFFHLGLALGQSPGLIHYHQVDIANLVHDLAAFDHNAHTSSSANSRKDSRCGASHQGARRSHRQENHAAVEAIQPGPAQQEVDRHDKGRNQEEHRLHIAIF